MTIPHEDLIRAVLDGKTVQWRCNGSDQWTDMLGDPALQSLVNHREGCDYRLKPEPRCVWMCMNEDFSDVFIYRSRPGSVDGYANFRHEFDPDTGEYLRTVKEDGHG